MFKSPRFFFSYAHDTIFLRISKLGTQKGLQNYTIFSPNLTSRERTVSGSSFTNEIMVETPCQKQKSSNLDKIEEDFNRLGFGKTFET